MRQPRVPPPVIETDQRIRGDTIAHKVNDGVPGGLKNAPESDPADLAAPVLHRYDDQRAAAVAANCIITHTKVCCVNVDAST